MEDLIYNCSIQVEHITRKWQSDIIEDTADYKSFKSSIVVKSNEDEPIETTELEVLQPIDPLETNMTISQI